MIIKVTFPLLSALGYDGPEETAACGECTDGTWEPQSAHCMRPPRLSLDDGHLIIHLGVRDEFFRMIPVHLKS